MELEPVLHQVTSLEVTSTRDQNDIKKKHVKNSSIFYRF